MLKDRIESLIRETFPGTKNVEFQFDGMPVKTWVESRLLPFLFYSNSCATGPQAINLFFDEGSIAKRLLPSYVALGCYKRSIKKILGRLNYQTQFPDGSIKVVHKGSVSFVQSIDYVNRVISIKNGMGGVTLLNFDESYQLQWSYSGSKHVQKQLNDFINLEEFENTDFFGFPVDLTRSEFEGAIFFTRKGAFIEFIKATKINGSLIASSIHIQEVIYSREDDSYELRSVSSRKAITRKPVSIVVAAQEDIYAFENILQSAGRSLAHIRTIIVDDFDDRVLKVENDNGATIDLKHKIKENILRHLHENKVRTVYFVNKSHNYTSTNRFWVADGHDMIPSDWLLTPSTVVEMNAIENELTVKISNLSHSDLERLLLETGNLCQEWRSLVTQYFCNGETWKGLIKLFWLRKTLNGVYAPARLKLELSNFSGFLTNLTITYFANSADNGLIEKTQELVGRIMAMEEEQLNHKLHVILTHIETETDKLVSVVNTFTPLEEDREYFLRQITKRHSDLRATLLGPKEDLSFLSPNCPLKWFILTFSDKWKQIPFFTVIGTDVQFILDHREFRYAQSYTKRVREVISNIDKEPVPSWFMKIEPIAYVRPEMKIIFDDHQEVLSHISEAAEAEDIDFEQILKSLNQSWKASDNLSEDGNRVCVLTDDGCLYTWSESKKIFTYNEGSRHIDECFRFARELQEGDKIILLKQDYRQNTNIKKTIEEILATTNEYETTLVHYNEWRTLIAERVRKLSNDWHRFSSELRDAGFDTTAHTISNWVDGTTTYPHKFKSLLKALSEIGVIQLKNAPNYLSAVRTVKSLQITFIREALKKMLSDIEGIEYSSENVAINEDVINSFIDKIEVKRVENILIESYAN